MVLLHEEEPMEDKRNNEGAEAPYSLEPQKVRPTGEFILVA